MDRSQWNPRLRIESWYRRKIYQFLQSYLAVPTAASLGEIVASLSNWQNLQNFFADASTTIAARMATQINIENARSWKEAARQSSRGLQMYRAIESEMETSIGARMREIVAENAQLISSIPEKVRESVNREISGLQRQGLRPETIAAYLRKRIPILTHSRAALISRTETSKSATALTRARSEDLGIEWSQWVSSEDARVRPSHRNLDKVLMRLDDPPQPEKLIGEKSSLGRGLAGEFP
jgi:uncharacterized protein with gpF-like domain